MEKTEENGNVGWTVQCRHSISKAVQEGVLLCKERQIKTVMLNVPVHWQFWLLYMYNECFMDQGILNTRSF